MGWKGCHVTAMEWRLLGVGEPGALEVEWCVKRTANFLFVAPESLHFPHGSDIKDTDGLVS